ncbi:BMA_0021/BMA_0022 family TOMM bacteriocin [Shewanella surugensis]|uniref:BMA_0021/BMA_0022 family TOMM bacteriocin n=1 Tax=Shewanella surugensis TaxID=212020 RepID=A0ABT0L9E1_9GAMM|nr:BMA_0021/BMA_0022 family TOMM bacteriocin [Shewanella surugensis]MCL1123957.1 BMA_0021/BMA_0022 family TOMM bacteriocin [Shewanella surugensis]
MSNTILSFKTAYLSAVAKSWVDKNFEEDFHREGENNLLTFLEEHSGSPKQFINPWKNLTINFLKDKKSGTNFLEDGLHWDPIKTGRWVGDDDRLTIYLPRDPEDPLLKNNNVPNMIDNRVEALAKYNFIFPTFMGKIKSNFEMLLNEKNQHEFIKLLIENEVPIPSILTMGVADFDLLDFSATVLRAISLYWEDDTFKTSIINVDDNYSDKTPILSKWFGYNNPWNFIINFKKCDSFYLLKANEAQYPANVISLGKPKKPHNPNGNQNDKAVLPIALAAYNDDGNSYPFTCC